MKRIITAATLVASLVVVSVSAAMASEASHRYSVVKEPSKSVQVSVTRSESTWFTGTDTAGKKVTVVFLPRFATVVRDGKRVPVSALRPDDRVEVTGEFSGSRLYASSARVTQPHTAAAR
jgi:uncharacterized cupredoxin-like copper-binding protein